MRTVPDDIRSRHPIFEQVREILTNPAAADAAGPMARKFAWYIETSARGGKPTQRHRPANSKVGPT